MTAEERPLDSILRDLQERAKELNCLYRVDEVLNRPDLDFPGALEELLLVLPQGWQYPDICTAEIVLDGRTYRPPAFRETLWGLTTPIVSEGATIGRVSVYYTEPKPELDEGAFLKEERRLINAIAERIGYRVLQQRLKTVVARSHQTELGTWAVIVDFLRVTDQALLQRITRRMINYLCWSGVDGADELLVHGEVDGGGGDGSGSQENRPRQREAPLALDALAERTFEIAAAHLREDEVLRRIQSWINEEKATFLYSAAEHLDAPLTALADRKSVV